MAITEPIDIRTLESDLFRKGDPVKKLLKLALEIFDARQVGILYGTNQTKAKFLPPASWDRGVMDRFYAAGIRGIFLRLFGKRVVTAKKLSPVFFYKADHKGQFVENEGMISHVLRHYGDYYKKGISVIICPNTEKYAQVGTQNYETIPYFSYDGNRIDQPSEIIKVDVRIVRQFKSSNSVFVYLPDYGILVINTVGQSLIDMDRSGCFVREKTLRERLDILIQLVENSSLANLGQVVGRERAKLLRRKEIHLRKTTSDLLKNEKRYRELYENAPIAYFSLSPEGRILRYNQKAGTLLNYDEKGIRGLDAQTLFCGASGEKDIAGKIFSLLKRGKKIKDMELKMLSGDGRWVWISLSMDTVKNLSGRIVELRAMVMDISARKMLEKRLLNAKKMEAMGTLSGGIAHDFNNVLSPISGYTEMLMMEGNENDPDRKYLGEMLEAVNHAKELVNQILIFSKQKRHEKKILNAARAVKESLLLVHSFLPATIKVQENIDPDCGNILADPMQLNQMIVHLVTNAYHAMKKKGGTLTISLKSFNDSKHKKLHTSKAQNSICLMVQDTGVGIDPGILDKIFDPYFSTRKEGQGSGVGLSVVLGIVESHGGHIRVETEAGRGTSVCVYLPEPKEAFSQGDSLNDVEVQKVSEQVLLVDDDKKAAIAQMHMLEKLGCKVTCFTNPRNAFQIFKSNPDLFDLVLLDQGMPELTGMELALKIRGVRPGMPVVLCVDSGESLEEEQIESGSIRGVLNKPLNLNRLSYALRQALDPDAEFISERLYQKLTG